MAILNRTKITNAMKQMVATSASFIDDHIFWIKSNPVDHISGAQVQRQMLNHLMILHEAFNNIEKIFGKKLNPISAENLSLYKKLYLLARSNGDIPACANITCEMEKELLSFVPDPAWNQALTKAADELASSNILNSTNTLDAVLKVADIAVEATASLDPAAPIIDEVLKVADSLVSGSSDANKPS